jgi:hypothetical protein
VRDDSKLCAPSAPLGPYILLTNVRYWAGVLVEWLTTHSIILWSSGCNIGLEVSYPRGFSWIFSGTSRKCTGSTLKWAMAAIHIPQNSFHNLSSFL